MTGAWTIRNAFHTWVPGRWVEDALCGQVDPELFFPEKGQTSPAAKAICQQCPVITECLDYALRSPSPLFGIWGGLSETQRKQIRREAS